MKHNIILIGFMGCGKSSVGKKLAECISYRFLDTDLMIERNQACSINQIFSSKGEAAFRDMETNLIQELHKDMSQVILSTGGGLVLREQNRRLLSDMGYIVFLKASKETTLKRLQGDATRPLLKGEELEQKVERMLESRTPIYEKTAHKIIATDHKSIEEIAHLIMEAYMKIIY